MSRLSLTPRVRKPRRSVLAANAVGYKPPPGSRVGNGVIVEVRANRDQDGQRGEVNWFVSLVASLFMQGPEVYEKPGECPYLVRIRDISGAQRELVKFRSFRRARAFERAVLRFARQASKDEVDRYHEDSLWHAVQH